jgi:emericellamide synthase (highly reducing iterative type I polyketide synthase)
MIATEGVVADRDDQVATLISKQGIRTNTIQEVLALVNYAIQNPSGESSTEAQILCGVTRFGPGSNTDDATRQRLDARFSHIWIDPVQGSSTSTEVVQLSVQPSLRAASDPRTAIEATLAALKAKISRLLSIPAPEIQPDRSVSSYGVDSLIAVELRNWIVTQVGAHIQMLELMNSLPMVKLAEMVARRSRFVKSGLFGNGENVGAN